MPSLFEKLGIFYMGKELNPDTLEPTENPTLLKAKDFTTHAAIIGMTGSGKTGLGIGLLEEAAIDNIPVIAIDPKGDLGNLALAFPDLAPEDFEPWVAEEARRKGIDAKTLAKEKAAFWQKGIESFGQDKARIARLAEHEVTIYTPGSTAGVPVNVLGSLEAPGEEVLQDADLFAQTLGSTVASLLALLGIEADPLESREYALIAQIIKQAWLKGETLDMGGLIAKIITPGFERIGVLPLSAFYPDSDRFKLAARFNNVLASPSFSAWLEGEPLQIERLLYDTDQKAKVAVFNIAHLGDEERMFFVTLLLNRVVGWMRRQSGTGRLRALLYMDEIYGYFPPSKNPPSKEPMMILLKQARAFGVGVVLSTQNPVDLDYKGLSNIGTWFIGRLQTRQDIEKVIEGLSGKLGNAMSKERISSLLASLPGRTFFLKSAHRPDISLFTTRWVLSYLKGPLGRDEIARLSQAKKALTPQADAPNKAPQTAPTSSGQPSAPLLPKAVIQRFDLPAGDTPTYAPYLAAVATVRYFNASRGIDESETLCLAVDLAQTCDWQEGEEADATFTRLPKNPPQNGRFASLPECISQLKSLKPFQKELSDLLYATKRLTLYRCKPLKAESFPGESEEAFKARLAEILEEKRAEEADKLAERYEKRLRTLHERLQRAQERLEKEKEDVTSATTGSLIDAGLAVFGALFGGRGSSAAKVGRAIRGGSKVLKEKNDVERAEARVADAQNRIEETRMELEEKLDALEEKYRLDNYPITAFFIKPRRSDITIEDIALWWRLEEA